MPIIAKLDSLLNRLNRHGEEYGFPYLIYGYYELFNYFMYFTIWYFTHKINEPYPGVYWHIFAPFLCLALVLRKYWPHNLKKFYTLFWYFTVMCTQICAITYTAFESYEYSYISIDIVLAIFILCLVLDWASFAILVPLGIICGMLTEYLIKGKLMWNLDQTTFTHLLIPVICTTGVGILFSRNATRFRQNFLLQRKLAATRTVAGMAHELRNPLATIRMSTRGIKRYNDILMENYYAAQAANLGTPQLPDIELMERVFKNVEAEINFSNTMIDTLLANSKEIATQSSTTSSNQIAQCVQAAIARYPFASDEERKLIQVDLAHDFAFQGDDLMVTHVIFNLLKNALHVIKEQQKGQIFISLELANDGKYNLLHFKDTAKGMSEKTRAKIFDSFYTETQTGTGVGLAFCTMIMKGLHGKIEVKSELRVFTEFVLSFPKCS
ncbi:MAG: HAMP domain-containing histidine kinase [Gammaproteobacteria bacterium]|nr:HAMP domain-containing histidine kinase [Gammaproteobacteria bacterium]